VAGDHHYRGGIFRNRISLVTSHELIVPNEMRADGYSFLAAPAICGFSDYLPVHIRISRYGRFAGIGRAGSCAEKAIPDTLLARVLSTFKRI
ncbi:MAG TPA: hypothetical protein PLX03_06415, partial [Candidatus Hydrogenedentes bacterium]|nr:hypothetical protein [Candidatus Hydrogenedentota bacterium]